MAKYRTIVADPPWLERGGGKSKRGADRHYPLMPTHEIIEVMADALGLAKQPALIAGYAPHWVHNPRSKVAESAHLWLWVTDNFLQDGFRVMDALGFRFVRSWLWVKMDVDEDGAVPIGDLGEQLTFYPEDRLQIGLGQYGRNCHEQVLFGVRGETSLPPPDRRCPSVFFAPKTKHSAKPQKFFDIVDRTSPLPALEMFARKPRAGWDVWGNEV